MPGGRPPITLDFDLIRKLYLEDNLTSRVIGNLFGVSWATILRRLKKQDTKVRVRTDYPAWNKGLSAKTDERVKRNTKNAQITRRLPENIKHMSELQKNKFKDEKYAERIIRATFKGRRTRPNKPEKIVIDIIQRNKLPLKYVGNGEVIIGRLNPDFINVNGKKEVVEIFGDYWHGERKLRTWKESELGRIMAYKTFGFNCKIIWEHEIYELPEKEIIGRLVNG